MVVHLHSITMGKLNMNKFLLVIVFVPFLALAQTRKQRRAEEKADKETLANLKAHEMYLASDSLEGRRTGTPGEWKAVQYVAGQFKKDGLAPAGTDGYIQEFDIDEGKQFTSSKNNCSINSQVLAIKTDFYPLAYSKNNSSVEGTASLDLREKGEPWFYDVKDLLEENKNNPHFDINDAIKKEAVRVKEKGATALVVFNRSTLVDNIQFNKNDTSAACSIPVIYITPGGVKKYLADATASYDIKFGVELTSQKRKAHNVIGYLNFNAPATVVLGAHLDHLGYGEDNNSLDGQGQIHNGADDNASGTSALIELGRILQSTPAHNNNYIFIAFSGEELGLFGSKYWLEHPSKNVVLNYMINMDMIGRYDSSKKLTIGGYGTSPVWGNIFNTTTAPALAVKFDSSGSGPSDHASFYRKDVPVLFFFTNSHSDYHKATDDWDKINYEGELAIVKYINRIIEATDNKGKLAFTKTRDQEARSIALPVTLGVIPDYGYSGTGMRIDGVSKGKLAEKLGLQAGDVLLQLGEYKFVDVSTYMTALQHFKKGDKTTLTIKRGSAEKIFDVQF